MTPVFHESFAIRARFSQKLSRVVPHGVGRTAFLGCRVKHAVQISKGQLRRGLQRDSRGES